MEKGAGTLKERCEVSDKEKRDNPGAPDMEACARGQWTLQLCLC